MESRLNIDGDRVETLEKQLREARDLAAESDRRFEEVMLSFLFVERIQQTEDQDYQEGFQISRIK